ncbi:MAG: hypothetical protein HQM16_12580 [Deltaproteobacteria bacterium]|nr:hypothetical protein [Deltaproteobacteria bacterium]
METIDHLIKFAAIPLEAENALEQFLRDQKITPSAITGPAVDFIRVFGNARFLTRFIFNHPDVFLDYCTSAYTHAEKGPAVFEQEAGLCCQTNGDFVPALKRYKYQELLRITIKELLGLDQRMIYRELAHLARAVIKRVANDLFGNLLTRYDITDAAVGQYMFIAMGKLGGLELNYSSDIDLIGIYDQEINLDTVSTHEFFVKLFTQLGQKLSAVDKDGFLYRTDWDLRPEGKAGTMANSIGSIETYYMAFGAEWERQAFIKASPVWETGDLSRQVMSLLTPFVYRSTFDEKTVKNIWDMKSKIVSELHQKESGGINIKLDEGGIRDIEFFVQGFQLLYGGRIKDLRVQNTLDAILKIRGHGLISQQRADVLTKSYLFLRRLESMLQMEEEQQTHTVKTAREHKLKLARRMGITASGDAACSMLDEELSNVRNTVRTVFREVYDR